MKGGKILWDVSIGWLKNVEDRNEDGEIPNSWEEGEEENINYQYYEKINIY